MTTSTGHGTASTHAAQQRTARVTVVAQPGVTPAAVNPAAVTRAGATHAAMAGACPGLRR
jgi:hypothetical protein